MFNEEKPRNATTAYEIESTSGVKTLAWALHLHFRIQEHRVLTKLLVYLNGSICHYI
jgi:hypothetical protein